MWEGLPGIVFRRVISLLLVLIVVLTLFFVLFRVVIGTDSYIPKGMVPPAQDITQALHSDDSLVVQYFYYIGDMLTGRGAFELRSWVTMTHAGDAVSAALPHTLSIFGVTVILSFLLGMLLHSLTLRTKNWIARGLGSSILFFMWVIPIFLVSVFLIIEFYVRLGWLPLGYIQMGLVERLKSYVLPIVALLIVGSGTFAAAFRYGANSLSESAEAPAFARHPRLGHVSETVASTMPIIKLSLAWIMSCVVYIDTSFLLNGLGRYSLNALYNGDLPLLETSSFAMVLVVLITGFIFDMASLLLLRYCRGEAPSTSMSGSSAAGEPESLARTVTSTGGWLSVLKRFVSKYMHSPLGIVGLVLVLGFAFIAVVGPHVTQSSDILINVRQDPVTAFLYHSRDSFVYALMVVILSSAIGLAIGLLSLGIGKYNYPILILAEAVVVSPILILVFLTIYAGYHSIHGHISLVSLAIGLYAWAPVTLALATHACDVSGRPNKGQIGNPLRRSMVSVVRLLRVSLPDALATVSVVAIIWVSSLFLYDYLVGENTWSSMISTASQRGYIEELSLWWILPMAAIVLMLAGFYLMLRTASETIQEIDEESRRS